MANTTDKSILTAAGKALLAQLNAEEKPLIIDKMMFANVPNRPEFPQPDDVVPTDDIVHQEQVEQRGRLSADSVIYSTTLTSDVGPFEFNWTGAYCSEYGVLVTIDHHALTPKTADEPGVAGNTLVRSVVLEYKDIAEITNITVDASSWQYNATDRMKKMDSDVAQSIIDQNGKDWFIEDGFLVTPSGSAYNIKAGAGYVSGNRVSMEFDRSVQVPNKPSFIYIDAHREGTPTGEQVTLFDFVITSEEKDDYIDSSTGKDIPHFVCKIAKVLDDGTVSDLRPEGESAGKKWTTENFSSTGFTVSDFKKMTFINAKVIETTGFFISGIGGARFLRDKDEDNIFLSSTDWIDRYGTETEIINGKLLVFDAQGHAWRMDVNGKIHVYQTGAVPGKEYDATKGIQAGLNWAATKFNYDNVNSLTESATVLGGNKLLRVTAPIYHPGGVNFEMDTSIGLGGYVLDSDGNISDNAAIIYSDISQNDICCWNVSGWFRNTGERINLFKHLIDTTVVNGGHVNTCRAPRLFARFYTDKYTGAAVQFAAAHSADLRFSSDGFLHPFIGHSSWSPKLEVYGNNYHTGGLLYNCNAYSLEGYSNGVKNHDGAPVLDESTIPKGWASENAIHNPASIRFLKTGLYAYYSNAGANNNSFTTEHWERARFYWNCQGVTETSPYVENTTDMLVHCVNTELIWTAPRIVSPEGCKGVRASGNSSVLIDLPATQLGGGVSDWDAGSQTSYDDPPRVVVRLRKFVDAVYSDTAPVGFDFLEQGERLIYVNADYGDDRYSGLSKIAPVKTLNRAIDMAVKYGSSTAVLESGTVNKYELIEFKELPDRFAFKTSDKAKSNPVITPHIGGDYVKGGLAVGVDVQFDHVNVDIPDGNYQPSSRSMLKIERGVNNIDVVGSSMSFGGNSSLLNAGVNGSSSILNVVFNNSDVNGLVGSNAYGSTGQCITTLSVSVDSVVPEIPFESNFKMVNIL